MPDFFNGLKPRQGFATEKLTIDLPPEQKRRIEWCAKDARVPMAEWARYVLAQGCELYQAEAQQTKLPVMASRRG